jgi:hypothetical protein
MPLCAFAPLRESFSSRRRNSRKGAKAQSRLARVVLQ